MPKKIIQLILLLISCILLVGCSSSKINNPKDGFQFSLLSDGTYELTSIQNKDATHLIIPGKYQNKLVTKIGPSVFEKCTKEPGCNTSN